MSYDHTYQPMIFYKYEYIDDNVGYPLTCFDIMPGCYLVYPDGRIYSLIVNRFLKPFKNQAGYSRINLRTINGTYKNYSIHRIVADTFIINLFPDFYDDVDHRDGNKDRNHFSNLQWCNNNQNKHYASMNGQYEHGEDRYNAVYSDEFAAEICSQFQEGIPYKEVYKKYCSNKQESSTIGSFIYKLYHRKTRREITDKFKY